MTGCSQTNKYVDFFKTTEAFELANAVADEDVDKIKKIVKKRPDLLNVADPVTGSNVLVLSLDLEKYESFVRLLELGANPNYINPYSKYCILIEACRYYGDANEFRIELKYIQTLLKYGADPNCRLEEDIIDIKKRHHFASSPLAKAARLDINLVKTLVRGGADPKLKLKQNQSSAFSNALESSKFDIINYFIDSIGVDLKIPLFVVSQKPDNKVVEYYIQDYVVNKYIHAYIFNETEKIDEYKRINPQIEEANKEGIRLVNKLEKMGIDFRNYEYKTNK